MTIPRGQPAGITAMQTHSHFLQRNPLLLAAAWLLVGSSPARAGEVPLREVLRDGLYAEEVNRDPEAAATQYEQVLARFNEQRDFAATALFRLAEVRRKQNRKDDAIALYQKFLTEFPESATQARLARENLAALGAQPPVATTTPPADPEAAEIARLEKMATSAPDVLLDANTLHAAASADWSKVVRYLLSKGSRPYEGLALAVAAERGNLDIVKQLTDNHAVVTESRNLLWG